MARFDRALKRKRKLRQLQLVYVMVSVLAVVYLTWNIMSTAVIRSIGSEGQKRSKKRLRHERLGKLIRESDVSCRKELGLDRHSFSVLCEMLRDIGGLYGTRNMSTEEIVAMFLYTLVHNKKNRSIGTYFMRSGESVSRQFNLCLRAVLKLHQQLLKKPTPIQNDCEDDNWGCFKNCLGALDNTYIDVSVSSQERTKYKTRKDTISMNVLGTCTPDMEFVYVLSGWEGSASNDRVLENAMSRPNGLKVPPGCYYLVDNGYSNYEGFLAPYKGYDYTVKEWGDQLPQSVEEYFNMRHARARNVIRKCFRLLKARWGILRSPSFFPIQTQGRVVMACCLLHNLIRRYMPMDDIEDEDLLNEDYDEDDDNVDDDDEDNDIGGSGDDEVEFITADGTTDYWSSFRDALAHDMFNLEMMEVDDPMIPTHTSVIRGRGKNKRFWTPEEDSVLLHSLLELASDSKWRNDNGFKSGYMSRLEEMLLSKLPHCGLRAEPHIDSRLKHWSEKYSALAEMLSSSRFGWDDEKKLLLADRGAYEEYVKTHKKAKGLYGVPFQYYDILAKIYGKDRATGEKSESFVQAIKKINVEIANEPMTPETEEDISVESDSESRFASQALIKRSASQSQPPLKKAKRQQTQKEIEQKKAEDGNLQNLSSEFGKIFQDIGMNLARMANAWSSAEEREQQLEDQSNRVLEEVMKLEGLAPSEALEVATILIAEESKLRVFYQAPSGLKKQYVLDLLKNRP